MTETSPNPSLPDALKTAAVGYLESALKGRTLNFDAAQLDAQRPEALLSEIQKSGQPRYDIKSMERIGDSYVINGHVYFDPPGTNRTNKGITMVDAEINVRDPQRGTLSMRFSNVAMTEKAGADEITVKITNMRIPANQVEAAAAEILDAASRTQPAAAPASTNASFTP